MTSVGENNPDHNTLVGKVLRLYACIYNVYGHSVHAFRNPISGVNIDNFTDLPSRIVVEDRCNGINAYLVPDDPRISRIWTSKMTLTRQKKRDVKACSTASRFRSLFSRRPTGLFMFGFPMPPRLLLSENYLKNLYPCYRARIRPIPKKKLAERRLRQQHFHVFFPVEKKTGVPHKIRTVCTPRIRELLQCSKCIRPLQEISVHPLT